MGIGMGDACEMLDGRDDGLDSCTEGEREERRSWEGGRKSYSVLSYHERSVCD
jgi:hypothetical protein